MTALVQNATTKITKKRSHFVQMDFFFVGFVSSWSSWLLMLLINRMLLKADDGSAAAGQ